MDEPRQSPFKLNRTRVFLLAMGLVLLLIALSSAMGGMSSYQALKEAANAGREAAPQPAPAPSP
jgi:hypothetical protein